MVSEHFPSGDRGGNDQWVPNKDGAGNMHAVWDSVMYTYEGYPSTVSLLELLLSSGQYAFK